MRNTSDSVILRNEYILERIKDIKAEHPFWGYRRVWAYLRYIDGLIVNKKRVYRLMSEHNLTVKSNTRLIAKRVSERPKPRPDRPRQWWRIDMTKVMTDRGWVYVGIVLDRYTKKIVGHYSGRQARSAEWLEALEKGLKREFPEGVRGNRLNLMSDNGCQPTSLSFMRACSNLGIQQVFTRYNNPKGNADTERMIRTMKEEFFWLREWENERELSGELDRWVEYYNGSYLHSALGYRTPAQAEEEYYANHSSHKTAT
ncbi:MAG: IS3 family transposase [Thermodesulfobacteriota bacterium]